MNKNDVLIECVAIAVIVGLSVLTGRLKILAYTGWAIDAGMLILFLLQLMRKDATMVEESAWAVEGNAKQ